MAKKPICLVPPRIFLVNKPRGLHSGDVLKHFKYNLPLGFGKIGHLGTLDPFAEGLLLIAIGQAARLSFLFEEILSKTYFASGVFNSSSTTGDCDGEITMSEKVKLPSSIEINNICEEFIGDYWQAPPHFSASKHNGKALYKYAREGILISKPPVKRTIYQISNFLLSGSEESCTFSVDIHIPVHKSLLGMSWMVLRFFYRAKIDGRFSVVIIPVSNPNWNWMQLRMLSTKNILSEPGNDFWVVE